MRLLGNILIGICLLVRGVSAVQRHELHDKLLYVVGSHNIFFSDLQREAKIVVHLAQLRPDALFFAAFDLLGDDLKVLRKLEVDHLDDHRLLLKKMLSIYIFSHYANVDVDHHSSLQHAVNKFLQQHHLTADYQRVVHSLLYLEQRYNKNSAEISHSELQMLKQKYPNKTEQELQIYLQQRQKMQILRVVKDFISFTQDRFQINSFF